MGSNELLLGNVNEDAELHLGQAEVYNHLFAYADSLVLRSAIELRIADIIHARGQPMSLSQIASSIDSPFIDVMCLGRVMRMLVRKKIFSIHYDPSSLAAETLYGLTRTSKWLLHDQDQSLAPTYLTLTHHSVTKPWYEISHSIKDGGVPFVRAHGETFWDMTSNDPEFNNLFNNGMAAATKPTLDAVVKGYGDGFSKLEGSLVDVGGGIGRLVAKIVKAYPHIKGINIDLPHVVANAPQHPGVSHIGGDIFKEIPATDNVIIKSVLHDWADEDCITILKNCQKAVSQKKGKVVIVDIILHPDGEGMFDNAAIALDMFMMTNCTGGKERTEDEWKILLKEAGFTHINIIPLPTIMSLSIIEAFSH